MKEKQKRFEGFVINGSKTFHRVWPSGLNAICNRIFSRLKQKIFYCRRPKWANACNRCNEEVSRLYKYLNAN